MSSAAVQSIPQHTHTSDRDPYPVTADAQQHQSPDLTASPASSRRQQSAPTGNGAPPNTPASSIPYSPNPSSAMSTPRVSQMPQSARVTPASRSSAAQDPDYSGRSDASTRVPASSPYSERQGSTRTAVPYNTPEVAHAFELDRSRENAGSTPGAAPQKRKDQRIFSEPQAARGIPADRPRQPNQSRSADAIPKTDARPAHPLSHEESNIINRLVITDPQEDVEREQARQAGSQPSSPPQPQHQSHASPQQIQQQQVQQQVSPQQQHSEAPAGLGLVADYNQDDSPRAPQQRSRQEHLRTQPRRETRFGDYILGQTIGEGEFGKVKLGWKRDGAVQVAIKLIRRESVVSNPNRLPKIYREIAILRGLQHPNIVRLHEMVETERHIGIIMEYASGGELFDYILNHRYLKDHAARRLFAQLVSGVGYLHKRGIVHRDLKLENLLLDRNKNIIITDFGFANTFNPSDELGEEIEYNLTSKDFVQRMGLEQIRADGHRRGDLMQTSCGSPCYAAPELVVSDSLYTGRKVDVWSCGVILYAMLAGYLPFDDDPANPEGDNINLLYKYIVSTPLTFPEYVTPHARDLLRRILVPDPRKRADLFEVARHSWLSDYAHVVSFITSTNASADVPAVTTAADPYESPAASGLGRSASVREPTKASPLIGGPVRGQAAIAAEERQKRERDAKRRTVQVEYVAPQMATARGGPPPAAQGQQTSPQRRARGESVSTPAEAAFKPEAPAASSSDRRPVSMAPPPRTARGDAPRAVSDYGNVVSSPNPSVGRPSTRGSAVGNARLPSRGNSYGQPSIAAVAPTNVEGRFSQPQRTSLVINGGVPGLDNEGSESARPVSQQFQEPYSVQPSEDDPRKHKRNSTVESFTNRIFGRSNSTRRQSRIIDDSNNAGRKNRAYPPVSMKNAIPNDPELRPRKSSDSRRSSFGMRRRESENADKRASKRFSFIPSAFSRMSLIGMPKDETSDENKRQSVSFAPKSRHDSKMLSGQGRSRSPSQETNDSSNPTAYDSNMDRTRHLPQHAGPHRGVTSPDLSTLGSQSQQLYAQDRPGQQSAYYSPTQSRETHGSGPEAQQQGSGRAVYGEADEAGALPQRKPQAILQKPNRRFGGEESGPGGSSGGARRVMNWFRNRGRERAG